MRRIAVPDAESKRELELFCGANDQKNKESYLE